MTETTLSVWKMKLQRNQEWMPTFVQKCNPRKLQKHSGTTALLFGPDTALVYNPAHQNKTTPYH